MPAPTQRKKSLDLHLHLPNQTASWLRRWGVSSLTGDIRSEFSNRLSTSLGMSYPERGLIRLNRSLLKEDQHLLAVVLCHELAHVVIYRRHGRSVRPHGPEWQALMRAVGFEPLVHLDNGRRALRGPTRRYYHTCPVCHSGRMAGRPMPRWRCSQCVAQGLDGVLHIEGAK
jgi:predicted SprT family Zn-dependent metalloprotease